MSKKKQKTKAYSFFNFEKNCKNELIAFYLHLIVVISNQTSRVHTAFDRKTFFEPFPPPTNTLPSRNENINFCKFGSFFRHIFTKYRFILYYCSYFKHFYRLENY